MSEKNVVKRKKDYLKLALWKRDRKLQDLCEVEIIAYALCSIIYLIAKEYYGVSSALEVVLFYSSYALIIVALYLWETNIVAWMMMSTFNSYLHAGIKILLFFPLGIVTVGFYGYAKWMMAEIRHITKLETYRWKKGRS